MDVRDETECGLKEDYVTLISSNAAILSVRAACALGTSGNKTQKSYGFLIFPISAAWHMQLVAVKDLRNSSP